MDSKEVLGFTEDVSDILGQEEMQEVVEEVGEDKFIALIIVSSLEILREVQDKLNQSIEGSERELEHILDRIEEEEVEE